MEKRALLAFVISVVVITLWTMWFSPPPEAPPPKEETKAAREDDRPAPRETPKIDEGQLRAYRAQEATATARTVRVETPLYEAQISERGGVLTSWKLKGYREAISQGAPLTELISFSNPAAGRPLEVRVGDALDPVLNSGPLQFDSDSVQLRDGQGQATLRGTLTLPVGLTLTKELTFHEDRYVVDVVIGLCDANGRPVADRVGLFWPQPAADKAAGSGSFTGPVAFAGNQFEEIEDAAKWSDKKQEIQWVGFALKYFLASIVPVSSGKKGAALEKAGGALEWVVRQAPERESDCQYRFRLYLGPKTLDDLRGAGHDLDRAINFGFFDIIARPFLVAMKFVNGYTRNYGIAIIIVTIVIKLLFWPLTHKSYASMKEMQRIQPRIKQIRERFKNDREQLNREMMLLYKTHKVNPVGGCLPMVLQIPVFFALYKVLMDSIELRQAPFIFWVQDLAAPDYLVRFPEGFSLFGIEGIGPLPILMGASMVIQQKMTPTMGDPTQAKIMMLMPIFFTFLFISFPSGLVLYWLVNNVLSIVQQIYINSRLD
jgi:YidC/Oxa1 family membrane protein insertase